MNCVNLTSIFNDGETNHQLGSVIHWRAEKEGILTLEPPNGRFLIWPILKTFSHSNVVSFWVRQSLRHAYARRVFSFREANWGNPYAKSLRGLTQVMVLCLRQTRYDKALTAVTHRCWGPSPISRSRCWDTPKHGPKNYCLPSSNQTLHLNIPCKCTRHFSESWTQRTQWI